MRPAFETFQTYITVEDVLLDYKRKHKLDDYYLTKLTNEKTNVTKFYLVPEKAFECDKNYILYTMSNNLDTVIDTVKDGLKEVKRDYEDVYYGQLKEQRKCRSISSAVPDSWCMANCNNAQPYCPADTCNCNGGGGDGGGGSNDQGGIWMKPPLLFPTTRKDRQKVKWLYTCSAGQGTACQPGGKDTNNAAMIFKYGINYISLITGAPGAYPQALNACEHSDQKKAPHILSQNSMPGDADDKLATNYLDGGCGTNCAQQTETPDKYPPSICKPTLQGVVSLPYTKQEIRQVHDSGCTVSLVLGAWNATFPNEYNNKQYSKIYGAGMTASKYAAIYYSRFMELRYKLDNALDGVDFDWEGFATGSCQWKGGCDSDWDDNCSYNGANGDGTATKTKDNKTCYQLADEITLDYINAICEIFKANPFTKDGESNKTFRFKTTKKAKGGAINDSADLYVNAVHIAGVKDRVINFGKHGPLSVTVVPMSSQQFSNKPWSRDIFNGQNQFVQLKPTNVDALLLQWYSGFDGGATTHTQYKGKNVGEEDWMPPWLKDQNKNPSKEQRIDIARGCKTGLGSNIISDNDTKLPDRFNTSLVTGKFCYKKDGNNLEGVAPDECVKKYGGVTVKAPNGAQAVGAGGAASKKEYVDWLKKNYPYGDVREGKGDIGGRCSADYLFNFSGKGYNTDMSRTDLGRCPRRLDCPDWYYDDDRFIHQSQLYVLHNLMRLGWNPATQLIIGLEFFDLQLPAANWEGKGGGQQWGPVPDAYFVGGLNAAIKGVDAYNKYYKMTGNRKLTLPDYKSTFDVLAVPKSLESKNTDLTRGILFEGGLAGVGGWTLAGANEESYYPWQNFLQWICDSNDVDGLTSGGRETDIYKFPMCNKAIPNGNTPANPDPTPPHPPDGSGVEYMEIVQNNDSPDDSNSSY